MLEAFEAIVTRVPGPISLALASTLVARESRGVTYIAEDFPVFWDSASGALVTDVDGNRYIDFTSAFGVAVTGHANPIVARAIAEQAARLPHGMGDVHPTAVKAALLEKLAALAPVDNPRTFLCSTGAESVEFALKTAMLATEEPDVLSFVGAYHGLSYGTLEVGGIAKFRKPWQRQLRNATSFARFPDPREPRSAERAIDAVRKTLRKEKSIGAVIVEPILGRGGVIVPPDGFLRELRALCTERDTLLILDEIYTGFGRTGTMFACEREDVRPDILCVGKALGGGFPISAAIASKDVASAWAPSEGEALHTSTYLGNPMGCAAALANLEEIDRLKILLRVREREPVMAEKLHTLRRANPILADVRGRGMLWGLEFKDPAVANRCVLLALARGLLLLQSGPRGETITLAPPPVISDVQLNRGFEILGDVLGALF